MYSALAVEGLWELALVGGIDDYEIKEIVDKYKAYAV